ncbi:MAG: adenylate kinase family protein [Candidatus Heimdallarchaeota archaeon]|nr:adenylate kinase family protein [Candidatus Heimdallarchaeota archaeon]MBY8994688.1 adenylate kinase family protein [Candidatus Heimdallarchaeota archaeon]
MLRKQLSQVILLSGTPGVGKTTISELLKLKGYSVLNFNDFIIQQGLYYGYDYSRESVIIDEEVLKSKIETELDRFDGLLFIEGHTSEIVPQEFVKFAFILRCNPSVLRDRLTLTRDYSVDKIEENIQAEIMDECLIALQEQLSSTQIFEIDTTKLSPEEIVEKITDRIQIFD